MGKMLRHRANKPRRKIRSIDALPLRFLLLPGNRGPSARTYKLNRMSLIHEIPQMCRSSADTCRLQINIERKLQFILNFPCRNVSGPQEITSDQVPRMVPPKGRRGHDRQDGSVSREASRLARISSRISRFPRF